MTVEHVTLDSRVSLREAARQKLADDMARFLAAGRKVTIVATDDYDHDAKHLTVSDHAKNGWENRRKGGD